VDFLVLPLGLLIATIGFVAGTIVILHAHSKRIARRRAWHWPWPIVGMSAVGIVAAIPAAGYGIRHFCTAGAGAQCGLGGVLGTGPMAFGVATLLYAGAYAIWDVR
jgi:hypothetical protein